MTEIGGNSTVKNNQNTHTEGTFFCRYSRFSSLGAVHVSTVPVNPGSSALAESGLELRCFGYSTASRRPYHLLHRTQSPPCLSLSLSLFYSCSSHTQTHQLRFIVASLIHTHTDLHLFCNRRTARVNDLEYPLQHATLLHPNVLLPCTINVLCVCVQRRGTCRCRRTSLHNFHQSDVEES